MRSFATAVVGADTTTYSYTPEGLTEAIGYPNGTSATYSYYPINRVETITHKDAGGATISSYGYQYDGNGNRTQQVELQADVTTTSDYVYDQLDRLESFTVNDGATTTVTGYTFDGYNRKTEDVAVESVATISKTYTYDETNWLNSVVDSVAGNTITYSYDDNGNTILKADSSKPGEDVSFEYDVANRLVQTTQNSTVLGKYDYNAQGMRIRHYGSERGDVEYLYDDGAVLEERSSGTLLAHYRYADRLLSLDAPSDGGIQYYHHDALGSTVNLTDSVGATNVSYSLDPWGHIRNQVGSSVNRQIFTGQEHDEQTGLIYFGARYYDPDTARFISQDSYLGEAGTPPSLHRYLYAYSNPTVYIDLYGYLTWDEAKEGLVKSWRNTKQAMTRLTQELPVANAKTNVAFAESLNNAYAKGVENGVPGLDNDGARLALTAGTTFTKAIMGVGSAPLTKAVETIEYAEDPSKIENFPIIATRLRDTYRASQEFAEEGSFENGLNVLEAASGVVLETAAVRCGVKAIAETSVSSKSVITVENRAGKFNAEHKAVGNRPPYDEAKAAREIVLNRSRTGEFVRVHGEYNQARPWIMRKKEVAGLSPLEIKNKYAIPDVPTKISDVSLPAGTKLRMGTAGYQKGWGDGGKIQFEIMQGPGMKSGRVPSDWFTNQRDL